MKMFICRFLCVLVVATPVLAQEDPWLAGLRNSQTDAPSGSGGAGVAGAPVRTEQALVPTVVGTAQGNPNCLSRDKKTIPLSILSGMLRTRGDSLRVEHDIANGRLKIKSGPAVSNCSSMIDWNLRAPASGFNDYVVEAKVKDCGGTSCPFTVVEVVNGEHVEKDINVAPTYAGFLQCLQETGAASASAVFDNAKVVRQNIDVSLPIANPNGRVNVYFGSQLPNVTPLYSEVSQAGCYMIEEITRDGFSVASEEVLRSEEIERQAAVVCRSQDYRQIQDFVDRYGATSLGLDRIARDLILTDVRALADRSKNNESISNEDLSVIDDFQTGVIEPLVNRMSSLYNEIQRLSPNDPVRRRKQQELTELASKLESYGRAPYLTEADINKLMDQGRFDEAEILNGIRLTISNYSRLGGEINGRRITPSVAAQRVDDAKYNFSDSTRQRRVDYDVRTGRITGRSDYYRDLAAAHRRDIQDRNADFSQRIQEQIARATPPGGVCYRMILSTSIQNCIQTARQSVERLQRQLASWNQEDLDIATDLDAKATRYAALEQEGRGVAGSSGEQDQTRASAGLDDLEPAPGRNPVRAQVDTVSGEGQYNFNFQAGQIPGQQQVPYQGQGQVLGSPWGGQPQQGGGWYGQVGQPQGQFQQNPFLGQNFGGQATFNQQAFMGQQTPWMQQPQYGLQQQYGLGQQGGGWYGQGGAGAFNPQQQLYAGYNPGMQFFGQQQNPFMLQGGAQTLPFMQQPGMMLNPAFQNLGTPQGGWYRP